MVIYDKSYRRLADFRARRTPTVKGGRRGATYVSALTQAESLWAAADQTPPLASPILRYYSLTQAALALAAASPLPNRDWQPSAGHGLHLRLATPQPSEVTLDAVTISSAGSKMMAQTLASTLDSAHFSGAASLGDIVRALPDQEVFASDPPRTAMTARIAPPHFGYRFALMISVPEHLMSLSTDEAEKTVRDWFDQHPKATKLPMWDAVDDDTSPGFRGDRTLTLRWQDFEIPAGRGTQFFDLASEGPFGKFVALPRLGDMNDPAHPLLLWTVALYGFSMLPRYHPTVWQNLVDLDNNAIAAPLRRLVDETSSIAMTYVEMVLIEMQREAKAAQNNAP